MNETTSISVLPEVSQSEILSLTSPRNAFRAAAVSKEFKSAADSDTVWKRFLPLDYDEIISQAVSPVAFDSQKKLYLHLSDSHILLDRGYLVADSSREDFNKSTESIKSFQLDKESGKKCYMLGARELSIAWQDDNRYWEWGHIPESRFPEVCILREVWWLEIQGRIAAVKLSPKSTYVAYLVFQTTGYAWGLVVPAKTKVSYGGTEIETENVYLERPGAIGRTGHVPVFPWRRKDGWMEIKLGEFECNEGDDGVVEMAFDEHEAWKNGLIVEGIELRPK